MTEEMTAIALPRYRSHKEVWALKIKSIQFDVDKERDDLNGALIITPEDSRYAPFKVPAKFVPRHSAARPETGWYWVRYADGYESFSPAAAFEEGYTRCE